MLGVESHGAIPWERFGRLMGKRGEMRLWAVEMKRCEECSVSPAPDNNVIVGTVLVTRHALLDFRSCEEMESQSFMDSRFQR
jgi:hypothetical protein